MLAISSVLQAPCRKATTSWCGYAATVAERPRICGSHECYMSAHTSSQLPLANSGCNRWLGITLSRRRARQDRCCLNTFQSPEKERSKGDQERNDSVRSCQRRCSIFGHEQDAG